MVLDTGMAGEGARSRPRSRGGPLCDLHRRRIISRLDLSRRRSLLGLIEDCVPADAAPDDVSLSRLDGFTVLPGGSAIVKLPREFLHCAREPYPGWRRPSDRRCAAAVLAVPDLPGIDCAAPA